MPGRLDQIESMLKARLGSALLASCPELVYSVSGILFRFLRTSDSLSALWRQLDSTLFNTVFQATGGRMRVTLDDGRSILATGEMLRDLADRLLALAYRRMDVPDADGRALRPFPRGLVRRDARTGFALPDG